MSQAFPSERPIVAFLTDFSVHDGYVGVMKGVVLGIASDAHLIDITHDIAPQNVSAGAWVLATSYAYFPAGTVFVCVVDPGVGSSRRSVALHAGAWYFVGPDNGLLSNVLDELPIHAAVELTNPAYHLAHVSSTFHGRDLFSPVAAHIARGVALSELGPHVDPRSLLHLPGTPPVYYDQHIDAQVIHIDHFGNVITNIPLRMTPDLFAHSKVRASFPDQQVTVTKQQRFFASDATHADQDPFIYGDSSGYVAVAIRNGNAASTLALGVGARVIVSFD
jgi:hypothetical protein